MKAHRHHSPQSRGHHPAAPPPPVSPDPRPPEGTLRGPRWRRWLFPIAGAVSLLWFLVRVLPKPIRATYPCQRAAFPMAAAFVVWSLALWGTLMSGRKAVRSFLQGRYRVAAACAACALAAAAVCWLSPFSTVPAAQAFVPSEGTNNPMGVARGIYPGRVVWVRNPDATRWDGTTGHWWDDTATDQTAVDQMLSLSLRRLSGAATDAPAWDGVFRHFNRTHGRGDVGYQTAERIAIKINCNNTSGYADTDNHADASPHSVLALLRQLVNQAGVPQAMITVYEAPNTAPSRVIPNRIFNKCRAEFPNVLYADCTGTNGHTLVQWQPNALSYSVANSCGRNIPTCVYQATYLINMALLKGHSTAGVTLTAKNHYGTINTREHSFIDCDARPMGTYNPFVDLIGHPHLGGKTLLFMIDGLYGVRSVGDDVGTYGRWNTLFGGQWSASYFLSLDPVAIDSVGVDFLRSEFGSNLGGGASANCDNYLHEAALAQSPPSGTFYTNQLNGTRLASLGVHEHWNNAAEKLYSRNLGRTNGIELVRVEALLAPSQTLTPAGATWKYLDTGTNLGTGWTAPDFNDATWRSGPAPLGYSEANGLWPRTTNSYGPDPNNKYITTYYRRAFTVTSTTAFSNLNLGIQRDDGAVVHLNGVEVFRSNLPAGPVNYLTLANSAVSGAAESAWYSTPVASSRLVEGTNVFAVEVHQNTNNSSDIFFDLVLTGTGAAPPPALGWGRSGGSLGFSWPDTPAEFVLQSVPSVPSTNWQPVAHLAQPSNGLLRVILDPGSNAAFFRLRATR